MTAPAQTVDDVVRGRAPQKSKATSVTDAAADTKRRLPLLPVAALLVEQHTLTAVERFAKLHEKHEVPAKARYYRDLIPLEKPRPGEQYAFEVDLDACTGCKACVSACHNLNGLDEGELWRTVGLLHGGTARAPTLQTITTSCHHCIEPACMQGCPTQAYEKDPVTGIVKHLDDQCFGCQYCTLMCPYDAPKYNPEKGIVRKCDMCSDRLAHGEAPACVQACPNGAIAISIVEQSQAIEASDAHAFLPGAPTPDHTLPTTVYKSERPLPANLLPADFYVARPEHSHFPLVVLLVFTQLAAGAFALRAFEERIWGAGHGSPIAQSLMAVGTALLALAVGVLHLGRPWLAWRAVLGLRTSWFSREALAFGLFAKLAIAYATLLALPLLPVPEFPYRDLLLRAAPQIQTLAVVAGVVGVFFSVMVYVATKRQHWSAALVGVKFFGTMLMLGAAAVLSVDSLTSNGVELLSEQAEWLLGVVLVATAIKLLLEGHAFSYLRDRRNSGQKRMARVMLGDLRVVTLFRFGLALLGGIALPVLVLSHSVTLEHITPALVAILALLVPAELAERYLFFRAAPASRMPGGLR
jgi:formate dehydrogenase iron-sulfur subunit